MRATLLLLVFAGSCWAAELPIHCNFDLDTPEAPPGTGGADQPTAIIVPVGGSILVKEDAHGLNARPCLIDQAGNSSYGSINFVIEAVAENFVIYEATLSINTLCNSYCMQTTGESGAVATRLNLSDDGSLHDHFQNPIGSYSPGTPFRCRMIIDMNAKNWSCQIDNELDGFEDDPPVTEFPFVNDASVVGSLANVLASLGVTAGGIAAIAYDDIEIRQQATPVRLGTWSDIKALY